MPSAYAGCVRPRTPADARADAHMRAARQSVLWAESWQQPVRMEPLQPLCIANIGLASRHVLGIAGVDKKHSEPTCIEKLENRYPVDAGRFHDDGLDTAF